MKLSFQSQHRGATFAQRDLQAWIAQLEAAAATGQTVTIVQAPIKLELSPAEARAFAAELVRYNANPIREAKGSLEDLRGSFLVNRKGCHGLVTE